ncbi:NAD(P)H-dependent oxidoreductase subunit E [Lutibacter sp.]|uniref:NAD(P)H-dependent oxidoreductase subunit E n=1 Tax=Lutibacter sp. TaxID=1925666 RepID=UPI0025BCC1BA|nr:NAD(P)H-dependent oxidoreductase subunit E [Lutibacter sp.]MCF6181089.1 NAD(P)H-dependent oxidoreductase subunit E [Lutibacter sp.]
MERTHLLNLLWNQQNAQGFISQSAITEIAKLLKISTIEVEGVITFYHFFHQKPTGKYIIYLNNSIISEFKGFREVKTTFEKETGCVFGKYDNNPLFSLFETSCIGLSDQEPAALINFYPFTDLTPEKVISIIKDLKNNIPIKTIADNPKSKIQYIPEDDKTVFFKDYTPGNSINKLKENNADSILKTIADVNLKGRGGAFFPTALKWQACKKNSAKTKYIICNADEGEPGTFKDKILLMEFPDLVIEGMIIAAFVVGAKEGIIYLRAEYKYLLPKLKETIHNFYNNNYLGDKILGINNFTFNLKIQLGAGAYVCGEETALIESLEGKRGEPRIRKYFPTDVGYLGKPTIVNNVETFANAARIIELGADYFKNIGTEKSKGTKLISVSGDVAKPGIYEIEWGMTVKELLQLCQATAPNYVQITGPSGECINETEFNRKICNEDLTCGGAIMVFNKFRGIIKILENFTKFFRSESCGVCTPCRAGNQILFEKIKKLKKGLCTSTDLQEIKDWGNIMKLTSRCGLGKTASNTFSTATEKFSDYFKFKILSENENQNVEFDMESAIQDFDSIIKDNHH